MLRALEKMKGAALAVSTTPSADRSTINEGDKDVRETVGKLNIGVFKLGGIAEIADEGEVVEGLASGSVGSGHTSGMGMSPKSGLFRLVGFHPEVICGARVGSGNFVCLKTRDACMVKAHKNMGNSLDLPLQMHFGICKVADTGKNPSSVLSDCFVRADLVPSEVLLDWKLSTLTAGEWAFRFQATHSSGDQNMLTPEKINAKRLEMQDATRLILEDAEELELSESWGDVQWSFSPTQTQHLLNVELERELFESRSDEAKFAAFFDQGALFRKWWILPWRR